MMKINRKSNGLYEKEGGQRDGKDERKTGTDRGMKMGRYSS